MSNKPVSFILLFNALYFMVLWAATTGCSKEAMLPADSSMASKESLGPLMFSGYQWTIKNSGGTRVGPGGNFFSKRQTNVSVDSSGYLHLGITKKNNRWLCAEVISDLSFGYGKYIFVTKGNVEQYDRNIVVGLFTWDDNTFLTQVNDELDIEFSKWGNPGVQYVMGYSVQPVYGLSYYPERTFSPQSPLVYDADGYTTHVIEWHSDRVQFESHTGDDTSAATRTQSWLFDDSNPPRAAAQYGQTSDAIVIPVPQSTTQCHINFWLFDANGNGKGDAPSNGTNAELVVKRFQFIPE